MAADQRGEERTESFTQSMNQKKKSQFSLSLIDQMFIEIFKGPYNAQGGEVAMVVAAGPSHLDRGGLSRVDVLGVLYEGGSGGRLYSRDQRSCFIARDWDLRVRTTFSGCNCR